MVDEPGTTSLTVPLYVVVFSVVVSSRTESAMTMGALASINAPAAARTSCFFIGPPFGWPPWTSGTLPRRRDDVRHGPAAFRAFSSHRRARRPVSHDHAIRAANASKGRGPRVGSTVGTGDELKSAARYRSRSYATDAFASARCGPPAASPSRYARI